MNNPSDTTTSSWPEIWHTAYSIMEPGIIAEQFRPWLQQIEWLDHDQTETGLSVQFAAENDFVISKIHDHYLQKMESALSAAAGVPCKISFITRSSKGKAALSSIANESDESENTALVREPARQLMLDPRYRFDNFVVGASNQLAHASAFSAANKPGKQFNPLFIFSAPGLGKTHLLHAIGNHLLSRDPNLRVLYISAEDFLNEVVHHIQKNSMAQFRTKYRNGFDVFLIDDIQTIAGKGKTQEEFFHTFNTLFAMKKQIVLTSDRHPQDIEKLEDRIISRIEHGLVTDIQIPEIETRIAILKAKAENEDIYLPDDVALFLATYIRSNVRKLEGVLIKLQAQCSLSGAEISLELAKQELKNLVPEESTQVTVETIQSAVARHFVLKVLDLKSETRAKRIALPRQICMFLIRKYTGMGYKEIAQYFGGKDHSTVVHACKKIDGSLESDPQMRETVESIQNLL